MIDLTDTKQSNAMARKVNALWNVRGYGGVTINAAEAGVTVEAEGNNWSDRLDDFLWIGDGTQWNVGTPKEYAAQNVRDWSQPGDPYVLPNFVGQWYEWYGVRGGDAVWRVKLRFPFAFTLNRIELYQITLRNGEPYWDTGQTWATDDYIYPLTHQDGSNENLLADDSFLAYPLMFAHGGSLNGNGTVQNTAYADALGLNYSAGLHTFYLYGDQNSVISELHSFRLIVSATNTDTAADAGLIMGTIPSSPTDVHSEI